MTDAQVVEEVMNTLEQASYLNEKVTNDRTRMYIGDVLDKAYEDLQVEIVANLDTLPYV